MANIGVIGSGSWGTALAWLLHNNGHKITLWSYLTEETEMFRQHHQNVDKLPGVVLADDVFLPAIWKKASVTKNFWFSPCRHRPCAAPPEI